MPKKADVSVLIYRTAHSCITFIKKMPHLEFSELKLSLRSLSGECEIQTEIKDV